MLSPRENLLMLVLLVFSTRFGGAEQTDTKNPNVTTVANTKGATRPREDRCVMHLGRVIIGCGSICRDGFHVSGTNGPRVVPPRRSVRVPTSEPRVQGHPRQPPAQVAVSRTLVPPENVRTSSGSRHSRGGIRFPTSISMAHADASWSTLNVVASPEWFGAGMSAYRQLLFRRALAEALVAASARVWSIVEPPIACP